MAKVDFGQALTDVFGEPIPESYTEEKVEDRSLQVCEKCGTSTPHHEMKQRPLTLGSVCVTSLISTREKQSDEEVVRRMSLAQRITGGRKEEWASVEFEDATEIASLQKAVADAPQGWSIMVRAAVIEALKV